VSGRSALAYYRERDALMTSAAATLGVTEDQLLPGLSRLQNRVASLESELTGFVSKAAKDVVATLASEALTHDGVALVAAAVQARDMDHLLTLVDLVRDRTQPSVVALAADLQGKAALVVSVSPQVTKINAGQVVRTASQAFGGGGGGTPQLGRGGGGDPTKLSAAVDRARELVIAGLSG
jgi:alanyl-tRNA synthetase